MQKSYARNSMLLLGISIVLLLVMTGFESRLVGITQQTERLITFLLLVLPSSLGSGFGILSLVRKEGRPWLALAGTVLNGLFAAFHVLIVLFAG